MNPKEFIMRQIGRARRVISSLEQIGIKNTLLVYTNRIFGALLSSAMFQHLVIKLHSSFSAMASLVQTGLDPETDTVTFVIPTWNGMKDNLPRLLESIRAQNWPSIKIIAVDSESSDETVAVLERFGAKVIPIKKAEFRHDYARNLGAEHADSKYIVFTVQDAWFTDPDWVTMGLKHLKCYKARSFSTPEICGPEADLYARFLSYNFISANRYGFGANVLGSKVFGALIYRMSDPPFRQRLIHVDDTNHLVERDFFLKHRYSLETCEDMEFGKKIITHGERFVFSTLTSITHFHGYRNHIKYFTRVFLDNLVINRLTGEQMIRSERNGAIDALFFFSGVMFKCLDEVFNYFENMGIDTIVFDDIRRDAIDTLGEKENSKMRYFRLLDIFERRLNDIDDATLIVGPRRIDSSFTVELLATLNLKLSDLKPVFDKSFFQMLRMRAFHHLRSASEVPKRRLNIYTVPIKDYRMYTTNLLIDVSASTTAWYCAALDDTTSATLPRLKEMNWV